MGLMLKGVSKSFGSFPAIKDLSMEVKEGTLFGFLGANGAGKTTTMRMILDLFRPDSGQITWNGSDVRGDLWLMGAGDPTLAPEDLATLAARVAAEGVGRIDGDVVGDARTFDRGWWAPGWLPGISRSFVARPVAVGQALGAMTVCGKAVASALAST